MPTAAPKVIVVSRAAKIAQLVGDFDRARQRPTANQTESRFKLVSTDLGVPFHHKGRTYLLFGDTFGPPRGDAIRACRSAENFRLPGRPVSGANFHHAECFRPSASRVPAASPSQLGEGCPTHGSHPLRTPAPGEGFAIERAE